MGSDLRSSGLAGNVGSTRKRPYLDGVHPQVRPLELAVGLCGRAGFSPRNGDGQQQVGMTVSLPVLVGSFLFSEVFYLVSGLFSASDKSSIARLSAP